jgi:hypothetical protein
MPFLLIKLLYHLKTFSMLNNNDGLNLNDQYEGTHSSLGDLEGEQQTSSSDATSSDLEGQTSNPKSESSVNEQDNNEEANLDADKADKNRNMATSYHDNQRRTTTRANEANDPLDTGSGGLSAGGVKSATDL